MNLASKSTSSSSSLFNHGYIRAFAASFHSTPPLEKKRRTHWNNSGTGSYKPKRFNSYAKRMSKLDSKRTLLRNMTDYAEYLFESWNDEDVHDRFSSSDGPFRRQSWSRGARVDGFDSRGSRWGRNKRKGGFDFCSSDDDGVETIFRSTFGGERSAFRGDGFYYWSFGGSSDNFRSWHSSSGRSNRRSSWSWRDESDSEDEETDTTPRSELATERQALGLNAFGPLTREDVKSAYHKCAMKWHPDHHQGSSKVEAEEKFKHCNAAYRTLCDKLAIS